MGAAGNKKPKKEKHGGHVASYEKDDTFKMSDDTFKGKKKK